MNPSANYVLPLDRWIQAGVDWSAVHLHPIFAFIRWPIAEVLNATVAALTGAPFPIFILVFAFLAWRLATWRIALFSIGAFVLIDLMGVWTEAMTTVALVLTAIIFCTLVGLPLGVACARSDRVWAVVRPILDIMQTTPTFVYLVPVVMLFGVGTVPGEVAVVVVALPPLTRFTNLGIRAVPTEMIEAGTAFGATPRQLLWQVQLPLALPTIMGGLNQTVLLAMVMAVIIAMIGANGLGMTVLEGLGRLNVGQAAVGGIAIVLIAITFDRVTQAMANPRARGHPARWTDPSYAPRLGWTWSRRLQKIEGSRNRRSPAPQAAPASPPYPGFDRATPSPGGTRPVGRLPNFR